MDWTKHQELFSKSDTIRQLMILSDLQVVDCLKKAVISFTELIQHVENDNAISRDENHQNELTAVLKLMSILIGDSKNSSKIPADLTDKVLCCMPVLTLAQGSIWEKLDPDIFSIYLQCLTVSLKHCSLSAQSEFLSVHLKLIEKYCDDVSVSYGGSLVDGDMSIENLMSILNVIVTNATANSDAYMKLVDLCAKLINFVSDDVAGKLVGSLIPKTLGALDEKDRKLQLSSLWSNIVKMYEDNCNERLYLVLCGLADFYFPVVDSGEPAVNLVGQNLFWEILQTGLCHQSSMTRKIALYLLKKIIDITEIQNKDIPRQNAEQSSEKPMFWWFSKEKKKQSAVWQDMILLMETLEEKQVHVIRPILPRFESLLQEASHSTNSAPLLHTSWIICVIQRAAIHESLYLKRWGAAALLSIDIKQCPLLEQGGLKFMEGSFIDIVTESSLYYRLPDMKWDQCPAVVNMLTAFLEKVFTHLSVDDGSLLAQKLFKRLCADSWNSSSVMYVMKAMSALPKIPIWRKFIVGSIRELLVSCIRTMDTYIRGALQSFLLKALVNLIDWNSVTISEFATALSYINSSESMQRGSPSWVLIKDCLNSGITEEKVLSVCEVQDFCSNTILAILKQPEEEKSKILPVMRVILLASDADILQTENLSSSAYLKTCLKPVFDVLRSVNTNAYMSQQKADIAVLMVTTLLSEAESISDGKHEDMVMAVLQDLLNGCKSDIFLYIERQLQENLSEVKDLERVTSFVEIINGMVSVIGSSVTHDPAFNSLTKQCINILQQPTNQNNNDEQQMKKVGAMIILSSLYCAVCSYLDKDNMMESFFVNWKPGKIPKLQEDKKNSLDKTWGLMTEEYMAAQWNAIGKCYSNRSLDSKVCEEYIEEALDMLDLVSASAVGAILHAASLFISEVSEETYNKTADICWRKIRELTKTSFFWPAYEGYIKFAVTTKSLSYREGKFGEVISRIFDVAEDKQGLVIILMNRLCQFYSHITEHSQLQAMAGVFVLAVGYGTIHGRGKRFHHDVKVYLSTKKDLSVNALIDGTRHADRLVQAKVISMLAKLDKNSMKDVQFGKMIVAGIKENLRPKMGIKTFRNYCNTQCHREKHRNVVALSILMGLLEDDKEFLEDFHSFVMEILVTEDQPSIRSYGELFLAKLCLRDVNLLRQLEKQFDSMSEKRTSCFCSLMISITRIAILMEDEEQLETFIANMMPKLFPLCMVYPVNLRTFAQVTILQLWQVAKERNLTRIIETHGILDSFNDFCAAAGNQHACRITIHLLDNFMLRINPTEDWNLDTLAFQLPRLTQLVDDEWISAEMFEKVDPEWRTHPKKFSVALTGTRNMLAKCAPGTWRMKGPGSGDDEAGDGDVQKKIQPWRTMLPSEDSDIQEDYQRKRQHAGQLVLVTSLIDKPANLGGLCRTSEIFGVSEFVIGKLKYVTDKAFESLCVTAHKWVPIVEVKPHDLKDYLLLMKREGYTLVGVEQTANSKSLVDYKFPVKTVLVLGNEKEGIPANLLQLLDVCVEIPQIIQDTRYKIDDETEVKAKKSGDS